MSRTARRRRSEGDAEPHRESIPAAYFDQRYARADDPWGLAERWYERRKYALTLAGLPRERYASGYEPACSIGVLTRGLAERCDRLLAVDSAPKAVGAARAAVPDPHVRVERAHLPADLPDETFDLVVLSEFLYYFALPDLELLLKGVRARLRPDGHLVCVHRRDLGPGGGWDGFNVHRVVERVTGLVPITHLDDQGFELDVLGCHRG
ncbi:nodulation protein S (NodS) [Nocardiopsis sp. Huas11]|uniref:class I SAM-dependent methyltransferase n=1 Tax=Nocardiopsis sp. Huas11 TaxID=2183912 RepID=UPI000EB4264C|nr:class I SAM-dependent methyltransferase [Nocardiopsis sp. Huas11]RKS08144.1 nodulation protein S (NodS) [Nocardiopsis sp. Huas11]